ncbi:hypothetical protein OG422_18880 [Streptomyces sp. NBC_01525]|uniref:hypothetical protein n=1 Tax=Streptomyces sp. NBC_01525 TaxID=2903893 RepID=UPI00386DD663
MSELATVSAEIAPYLAMAASSLGTSVLTAAQQRITERTVDAGEGFFRRLLGRDGDRLGGGAAPVLDVGRATSLDARLARLDDTERRALAEAMADWLAGPVTARDAAGFLSHMAPHLSGTTINSPTTYGDHSAAIGVVNGTVHLGGGTDTGRAS